MDVATETFSGSVSTDSLTPAISVLEANENVALESQNGSLSTVEPLLGDSYSV